jgi:SAM-dependent methyltransferase
VAKEDDGYFGKDIAETYDADVEATARPEILAQTIAALANLARGETALEFAIGTGRIALPLAAHGVKVEGIELSAAMIEILKSKPSGNKIPVVRGDMATATTGKTYDCVYLVFNTIMNLTTQSAQVDCFRNAAKHLKPGGMFLIETMIPQLRRLPPGQSAVPFEVSECKLGIDTYDVLNQGLVSHHWQMTEKGPQRYSVPFRYVWPAELDLMAEIAGLRLKHRWRNWNREPLTENDEKHVSVWEKPA